MHEEHRQILAAVRRRNRTEVAELTRLHLATSHDFVLRYLLEAWAGVPVNAAGG